NRLRCSRWPSTSRRRAGVLRGVYRGGGATQDTVDTSMKRGTRGRKSCNGATGPWTHFGHKHPQTGATRRSQTQNWPHYPQKLPAAET
ncbi:MAG: hypothetical protein QQN63_14615, partial [Nitrosopumilus sp.]